MKYLYFMDKTIYKMSHFIENVGSRFLFICATIHIKCNKNVSFDD